MIKTEFRKLRIKIFLISIKLWKLDFSYWYLLTKIETTNAATGMMNQMQKIKLEQMDLSSIDGESSERNEYRMLGFLALSLRKWLGLDNVLKRGGALFS